MKARTTHALKFIVFRIEPQGARWARPSIRYLEIKLRRLLVLAWLPTEPGSKSWIITTHCRTATLVKCRIAKQ